MTLTNLKIEKITPALKPRKYADSEGLYLQVNPNGTKCWRLKYRFLGKEKVLAVGTYPEISLLEARNKRHEAKNLIREGKDPNLEKQEKVRIAKYNAYNKFSAVALEWFNLNKDSWTEKYSKKVWSRMENYVFPVIGNKPISEVSGLEILEGIIRKIERQGKTETSHKLLQNCAAIFRLAFLTKRVPYNPLTDLRGVLKSHRAEPFPTIKIAELPEFLCRLEKFDTALQNKLAIKMLLLTFVRQGELRRAKWEYFDFEKRLWIIPAELMKMRQEHIVPLSDQLIALLEQLKTISGDSDYLFPTKNKIKYPYMNENVINDILKNEKMGYKGKLVAHGFRSLASTTLNELGYPSDIIEKQLAHEERNQVRKAYNRAEYLPQRIEMMQGWADHIDLMLSENKK